ncbi:MAG: cytochrome-c oxidase, cbb3-type subunit II [Zoogloeaceae bacterium]|jgi:cytochrome c oxidase cbb3-type subunit 2|nr:cytochrome-c oxidase, cbb3-type subunit II [Zoogloeaceae bacterium]
MSQEKIEKNAGLLIVCILLAVIWGGLVEIVPLFFQNSTMQPVAGVQPYGAVELAGRDVYIREGCYVCHSQMIRPFRAETERYGHYSVAGEFVYDHPFQWGSKRTGPDLHRVGNRYSDEWHRTHLRNPRAVEPDSNMPAYFWLKDAQASATVGKDIVKKMKVMALLGAPYTEQDYAEADTKLAGKTEEDVLIAYLQSLGTALSNLQ